LCPGTSVRGENKRKGKISRRGEVVRKAGEKEMREVESVLKFGPPW